MFNKKIILKTFLDLVKIDSPSGHEKEVAKYIIGYFKKINIPASTDGYGNVIANVSGIGNPLLLNAHMDTVEPGRGVKPIVKGDIIKTDGMTVLGADDKASIAAILEAVKYLKIHNVKHRPLEIVFTREEESTFGGVLNLNFKKLKSKLGLILDRAMPLGCITIAAPFVYLVEAKIIGRAAHAGAEPEKGISAIQIAAKAISELKLGRNSKTVTSNIGLIKGGTGVNVVPETVEITGEVRGLKIDEAQEQVDLINKAFKKYVRKFGAKLIFKSRLDCYGYNYSTQDKFIQEIAKTNKKMEIKNVFSAYGGVSDANVFVKKHIKAVVISYGALNIHTTRETIRVSELEKLTEFIVAFVRQK